MKPAAVVGDQDRWRALETAWVERTGGRCFHATECDSDTGDFASSSHHENKALYKDLTLLLANSGLNGFGIALEIQAFRKFLPTVPHDYAYYRGFVDVVHMLVSVAGSAKQEIKIIFDHRKESEYNAGRVYDFMVNLPEWKENVFLDTKVSFESRTNPRIQVADLFARETMKHLDNIIGPVKRGPRKSMLTLDATTRFTWLSLGHDYFEEHARELGGQRFIHQNQFYLMWLLQDGLQDNLANRFRFLSWCQAQPLSLNWMFP